MTVRQLPLPSAPLRFRVRLHPGWWRTFAKDWAIALSVILVYFVLRGQAGGDQQLALQVTKYLIEFERATHTFWEPAIQEASLRAHWVQEFANGVYAYLHFPVLIAVGLWLWFKRRAEFLFLRSVMFISMVFGLAFYYFLPAAPPRLLALHGYDLGFVDTVFGGNTAISYAQPSLLLNEYAAIPSFHFGWIALASAAMWINSRSFWVRVVAVLLSLVMTWAIIASANHFWVDMALGGIVVAISWAIARFVRQRGSGNGERGTAA